MSGAAIGIRRDLFAEVRERRRALEARIAELAATEGPLVMTERLPPNASPRVHIKTYLVSRDPGGVLPWRLTWFLDGVPAGHTGRLAYAEALRAADDYGADVLGARAITAEAAGLLDVQPGEEERER